ncbi:MAG: adenosine deaminase family protein [Deltaproteobacteria bacterium]|nr:adenosine deaminase family protein [Deltaproteobacteria bacterium]
MTSAKESSVISKELIEKLPKTDLHVHLDGSVRLSTLIELAREYNVKLPSYTEEGLKELVFKPEYESLVDYLKGFDYTCAVLQSELALERTAYELAQDNQQEGVRYVEVRFAPQLHVHAHLSMENVLKSVNRGMERAKKEFNQRSEVREGQEPPFEYSIVVCALRYFSGETSEYYHTMFRAHAFSPSKTVFSLASLELAQAAVQVRDEHGIPITGFDLAGAEAGYPAEEHIDAYAFAHKFFMMKTVHAGEAYGPESIFQAITDLHADRIGHGTFLLDPTMITDSSINDREGYVKELAQYIADRRITLEICLTSNMQTNPKLRNLSAHPFRDMMRARLSTTICTDNRTVSNTTVSEEIHRAMKYLDLGPHALKRSVIYGFKRSFFPGGYLEKRRYVRRIIDYYESLERAHPELMDGGATASDSSDLSDHDDLHDLRDE